MKWIILLLIIVVLVAVFTLRAAPGLSAEAARALLKQGALLVDVRTVGEFSAGHLPNAVNIPLGELEEKLPRLEPDRSRGLLLYCRSGRRSGIAERELRGLGYTNAFNLGSFEEARKITDGTAR